MIGATASARRTARTDADSASSAPSTRSSCHEPGSTRANRQPQRHLPLSAAARAVSRFATFEQAISSTSATTVARNHNGRSNDFLSVDEPLAFYIAGCAQVALFAQSPRLVGPK